MAFCCSESSVCPLEVVSLCSLLFTVELAETADCFESAFVEAAVATVALVEAAVVADAY